MLQLLVAFIYELVNQSWLISTVLVKYFLLGVFIATFLENRENLRKFKDNLLDYSPFFVASIVFIGLINMFIGFFEEPFLPLFSEVVAFVYFLFLFWEY